MPTLYKCKNCGRHYAFNRGSCPICKDMPVSIGSGSAESAKKFVEKESNSRNKKLPEFRDSMSRESLLRQMSDRRSPNYDPHWRMRIMEK